MSVELPEGFEGIIITGGQPFEQRLAIGFEGIVLTFSTTTAFITVINGLNRPIQGVQVTANNGGEERDGLTDENGMVILEVAANTTILFEKDKAFKTLTYDRSTDGNNLTVRFEPPVLG